MKIKPCEVYVAKSGNRSLSVGKNRWRGLYRCRLKFSDKPDSHRWMSKSEIEKWLMLRKSDIKDGLSVGELTVVNHMVCASDFYNCEFDGKNVALTEDEILKIANRGRLVSDSELVEGSEFGGRRIESRCGGKIIVSGHCVPAVKFCAELNEGKWFAFDHLKYGQCFKIKATGDCFARIIFSDGKRVRFNVFDESGAERYDFISLPIDRFADLARCEEDLHSVTDGILI